MIKPRIKKARGLPIYACTGLSRTYYGCSYCQAYLFWYRGVYGRYPSFVYKETKKWWEFWK